MRKSAANDDVLSTREAAERLGVALRTVQLWVENGVLPAWKTAGGHRRISRQAVEKLLEQRQAALNGGPAPVVDPTPAADEAPRRLRLLVVEDEPELRRLFLLVIERWELPIDVSTASDGFEALLSIGRQRPHMLLTDLHMPGMDGFRMIDALCRSGQGCDDMEIIVVTALDRAAIAERGGLPESVRVYNKPVPFDALEQRVRSGLAALGGLPHELAGAAQAA